MDGNKTLNANFIQTFALTTSASPAAGGTVTRNPNAERYNSGTTVQVTAVPAAGYRFVNWSGASTSANTTVSITMSAARTLTANFELINPLQETITATVREAGKELFITDSTLTKIRNMTSGSILLELNLPLGNANSLSGDFGDFTHYDANAGKIMLNSGMIKNVAGSKGYIEISISSFKTAFDGNVQGYVIAQIWTFNAAQASFSGAIILQPPQTAQTYTLTVNRNPAAGGSVTRNPDKANYNTGETVTVTASANANYTFTGWSGASTAAAASVQIIMNGDKTLTANFQLNQVNPTDMRIRINKTNNTFEVAGRRIWMNGVNTPWNNWDEMGSNNNWNQYNNTWWDNEFAKLKAAGINSVRIWMSCKNEMQYSPPITINSSGQITAVRQKFWTDLDQLFALAEKHKIYVMATLISFDHFVDQTPWQNMINSQANVQSFAQHYTIPFVNRYKNNPYLWSIDICNEIDWIRERADAGAISWANIQYFIAYNAAVIRQNSEILVTVGFASPKYNGADSQQLSDTVLKSRYNNEYAVLDFWSPHYYEWVSEWYGVPHYLKPSGSLVGTKPNGPYSGGWQLDASKPAVIGECAAVGTGTTERNRVASALRPAGANSITTDFEHAYSNGWQGVMPWTSNGVDYAGNLDNMKAATLNMESKYFDMIFPWGK